jgi:hypothetical protein
VSQIIYKRTLAKIDKEVPDGYRVAPHCNANFYKRIPEGAQKERARRIPSVPWSFVVDGDAGQLFCPEI